ncbi:MAG: hypothetical protein GKC03_06500 [Methanomassiliicoccales archaeon]|nr:hypothetical protein [Methanomassiliicoccales archaeon]NYT15645.1 hypothetical protein [Methanomassiliicoccales archaeon]
MTSKVRVDMPLCSHETSIEVEDSGDGTLQVRIETTCEDVARYAELIKELGIQDYSEFRDSKILEKAAEAFLTPTCLVPSGVFNACWLETGMISRNLVKKLDTLCIRFEA